jgi:hypothetical protein
MIISSKEDNFHEQGICKSYLNIHVQRHVSQSRLLDLLYVIFFNYFTYTTQTMVWDNQNSLKKPQ